MFNFIRDYRVGKKYEQALKTGCIYVVATLSRWHEGHPDGRLFGFAVADYLLGQDAVGEICAYRTSHLDAVTQESERLMTENAQLREFVLATLLIKALSYKAHNNNGAFERLMSSSYFAHWGVPELPKPDAYLNMAAAFLASI